ncbi:MAG: glycosyltransferase [Proteobacteria bacterium]|nr:glycosyltransferase [Pseudomonadota bacterium]
MAELERYDPAIEGKIKYEHLHRYALAAEQVVGLRVLDIASGEGYGSAMLANVAASVEGVDISSEAVGAANVKYGREGLKYHVGDAAAIPFGDATFDAVISFETIEHIPSPKDLLREIKRVLKPGGFAMISTPNKYIYNRGLKEPNHFHINEMEMGEFTTLLQDHFKHYLVLGQRMVIASTISPANLTSTPNSSDYHGLTVIEEAGRSAVVAQRVVRLPEPEYLVCLVSDEPVRNPEGLDSIFLSASPDLWTRHSEIINWASGLHEEDEGLRQRLRETEQLTSELENTRTQVNLLQDIIAANQEAASLPLLAALASDLAEAPVEANLTAILRAVSQATVRQALHETRRAEAESEKNQILHEKEEIHGMLLQAMDQVSKVDALRHQAVERATQAETTHLEAAEQAKHADEMLRQMAEQMTQAEAARHEAVEQAKHVDEMLHQMTEQVAHAEAARHEAVEQAKHADEMLRQMTEQVAQVESARHEAVEQAKHVDEMLHQMTEQVAHAEAARHEAVEQAKHADEMLHQMTEKTKQSEASLTRRGPTSNGASQKAEHDRAFAAALRQTIQQSAVDQIAEYRAGFSAALTVRSVQRGLQATVQRGREALGNTALYVPPTNIDKGMAAAATGFKALHVAWRKQFQTQAPEISDDTLFSGLFDPSYYMQRNNVVLRSGETPFDHYVRSGRHKGLSPHPLIDPDWISATWPDHQKRFDLFRYLQDPSMHGLSPHPVFDAGHYQRMNQDIVVAGVAPLAHYVAYGWRENRDPNQLFASAWYLSTHFETSPRKTDPLRHYVEFGRVDELQPHPLFDRTFYLEHYPDIAQSGMDPYIHFIAFGRAEGRAPNQRLDQMENLRRYFDADTILDIVLGENPERRLKMNGECIWPPVWDGEYWLPQALRDFTIDRYGEDCIDLMVYLFSVIERYSDAPDSFDSSFDAARLVSRAKMLAAVPVNGAPRASIVIPVYNNLLYTLTCIVSVLESAPAQTFEIIVADDCSTDGTAEIISSIGGLVRHVQHPQNLGFLGNCNAAAEKAAGDYVVLLNNDTIVMPGWLDNLLTPFVDTSIGLTGSKLLNGDGTLQEAGGLFWADGSAWNFGRGQDPLLPAFNYQKDVDYISGASIALPTSLWRQLGGFDPIYSPAYCEDSDLAFRIRATGYRTVYQPHSVLVHHEGRSHGRDTSGGIKAYQIVNQAKLLDRWRETLIKENLPHGEDVFLARDRSRNRPHILIIDHYLPQWDQDAGSRTMLHFIRAFVEKGFQVTIWPDNLNEDREYAVQLQRMGVEVIYGRQYLNRFDAWMGENGRYLDYVLLSRPHIAERYIDIVRQHEKKIIYYGHDLHCMRARSTYEVSGNSNDLIEAEIWESRELAVARQSNVVMYPGIEEVAFIAARMPANVNVIRPPITIFDEHEFKQTSDTISQGHAIDPYALMFVGGFAHSPNGDGIGWFLDEVWPLLRAHDKRFTLRIAGSHMPDSFRARTEPGVSMLGRVSEQALAHLYASSGVAIVPLRFGGGIKGKVIEAFAKGVPVVMTEIGAQGIVDPEMLGFVASSDSQRFADAVIQAAGDRDEALRRASQALSFLRRQYSQEAFCQLLGDEVPELLGRIRTPS